MPTSPEAPIAETRLARELAQLPDEARIRVVLGALAIASDPPAKRRRLTPDAIAALAATVIAVATLALALDQARTQRKQLAATVWPSVRVEYSNLGDPEHPQHRLGLVNGGVGPARIQALTMIWHDRPVSDLSEWVKATCPDVAFNWTYSTQTGALLSPGTRTMVVTHDWTGKDEQDRCIDDALQQTDARVCYCSVLDDCWAVSRRNAEPAPVRDCRDARRQPQFEHGS
jgi:hypothetical protein